MSEQATICRLLATDLRRRHPDIFGVVNSVRHLANAAYLVESALGEFFVVKVIPSPPREASAGEYNEWRSCWSPYDKEIWIHQNVPKDVPVPNMFPTGRGVIEAEGLRNFGYTTQSYHER